MTIELSVCFFLFLKDCGPLVRLLLRATLLTPLNFFWALLFNSGVLFSGGGF